MTEFTIENLQRALFNFEKTGKRVRELHVSPNLKPRAMAYLNISDDDTPRESTSPFKDWAIRIVLHHGREDDWWLSEK